METLKELKRHVRVLAGHARNAVLLGAIILVSACSSDDKPSTPNDPPPQPTPQITLNGKVQKGEFTNLQVDVYPVGANGQFGEPFQAQTNGSEYNFAGELGQVFNVRGHGTFIDEITGEERNVSPDQPLQSVVTVTNDSQNQPHNVNIFTTLATQMWLTNNDPSASPSQAYAAEQSSLAQSLGFEPSQNLAALDITSIQTEQDPSFILLTLGASLLLDDPTGTLLPPEFSNMLDLIAADLPVESALNLFNGIDIAAVYTAIQTGGFVSNLPEFTIPQGSVFVCEPLCRVSIDLAPTVTINNTVIYEGQGRSFIRVTRSGDLFSELTVNLNITDASAVRDQDYATIATSVRFGFGASSTRFAIDPVIDTLAEGDEQLNIALSLPEGSIYALRRANSTLTIKDGRPPSAQLPEQLALTTSGCFVAVGLPSELLQSMQSLLCASDIQEGFVIDTAATNNSISLQFLASVESDCSTNACGGAQFWPFSVLFEAVDTTTNLTVSSEQLGDLLYDAELVRSGSSNPNNAASQSRFARISADAMRNVINTALANTAAGNNNALRLRLVAASNQTANVLPESIDIPRIAPAAPIQFGDSSFELIAGAVLGSGENCPNDGDIRITGTFVQSTDFVGVPLTAEYAGEVCATFQASPTGGAWQVSQSDIDITGEDVILPEGMFYFAEVSGASIQNQRTSGAIPFATLGSAMLTPEVNADVYFSSDNLPFAFRAVGGRLTENGIVVSFDKTVLLEQMAFDASDPRATNNDLSVQSNTNIYANINAGEIILGDFGLNGVLTLGAGDARTAWPKGTLAWQSTNLEIIDGELQDHSLQVSFSMRQSRDCNKLSCSQGNTQAHSVSGMLSIDTQGTGIGAAQYSDASTLAWGALAAGNAWELQGAVEQNAAATLVLPGFIQRYLPGTSDNAADGLMAHRRSSIFVHGAYGPGSDEFILGNFFAAGINLGPELYVDGNGQPQTLNGQSLSGLNFSLSDGVLASQSVSSHEATKFVIQNAGVTGVVNADPSAMPTAFNASGFDINLTRFALRTQNNNNDSFNWVDGSLRLEGDAKIGLAFDNLALGCDGSLGDAQMLAQACGEQCRLDSWRADIDIFKFEFSSAGGQALACSSERANLSLDHDITFKALDKNIALKTLWNAQGELQSSSSNSQSQYTFDSRSSKSGYPIIVESLSLTAPLDVTSPETIRYGTLELQAKVGVPFWLPLEADLRLANTTSFGTTVAEPSVVVPRTTFDTPAFRTLASSLNFEVQAQIAEDAQFDFEARYDWGRTGFGFQLPVFYDVASANQDVSFLGRRKEIDMFVLDAGAGIDFIQPDRTKLSFGASADFAALKKVRFQVDLTDTAGLAKIDELLVQAGVIQQPVITPTFENVSSAVSIVNDVAGRGLDPLMEKLLLEAVTRVGQAAIPAMPNQKDPFDTLADSMAEIKNFPNHLITTIDDIAFAPVNDLLDEQEAFLRGELLSLVQEIASLAPGEQLQGPLKDRIDTVRILIADAEDRVDTAFTPVDAVLSGLATQLKQIDGSVAQAQAAREEIEAVFIEVTSVVASQCAVDGSLIGSESAGYLQAAFQQLNDVKNLVQLLSSSEALGTLAELVVDDPKIKETINDTQETLREGATALLSKVAETEVAVRNSLCQSDATSLLTQVTTLLQQIDANIAEMQVLVVRVDNQIINIQARVKNSKILLVEPLGKIKALIGDIERLASERLQSEDGEAFITTINSRLAGATENQITALVTREAGETDVFDVAFEFVRTNIAAARRDLLAQLKQDTKGLFPYGDMSADQLRRQLVTSVMASPPVSALREELNTSIVEIIRQANSQMLVITDQANAVVQEALAKVENQANKVLEQATAPVRDIPLDSAKLDGFAVIAGNELERAHIGAQWTMSSSDESEPGNTFGAALDAVSWSANGKAEGCAAPGAESNLDVTISALGIPAKIGESEITIKKVYLGFTLGSGSGEGFAFKPIGVNGGISTAGNIGFTEFVIYDPAFAAGIGLQEVYLGASAGAIFSDIQAEVAFLVGKTCNQDILLELDPKVAQYIPLPATGFTGAYVRGAASVPIYTNGCPLTIGLAADVGAWILKGPPITIGGLVGGGAYGKVGCVGALRGQIRAIGQVNSDGDFSFVGEGFGVAGLGLCEPAGWTSLERSRQDTLCGTADAVFTAGYVNGWSVFNLSVSAIH